MYICKQFKSMNLIERFKYLMKINKLTAASFADEIGVQRSSISHILSGRNKPSLEFIQKILAKYPKVSADWLINGNTSPTKNSTSQNKTTLPSSSSPITIEKKIKKVVVFYTDNTFEEIIKEN